MARRRPSLTSPLATVCMTSNRFNKSVGFLPKAKVCKPPPPPPPPRACRFHFDPPRVPINDGTSGVWLACSPGLAQGAELEVAIDEPVDTYWTEPGPEAGNCVEGGCDLITGAISGTFIVVANFLFPGGSRCRVEADLEIYEPP